MEGEQEEMEGGLEINRGSVDRGAAQQTVKKLHLRAQTGFLFFHEIPAAVGMSGKSAFTPLKSTWKLIQRLHRGNMETCILFWGQKSKFEKEKSISNT